MSTIQFPSINEASGSGLEVGAVHIASTFMVTPHDALDYERSAFVHEGGAEGLQALQRLAPMSRGPGACAPALVLSRAVGTVLDGLGRAARPMTIRNVSRLRCLAAPVLGEPLTPVSTVRFVSRSPEGEHVTLSVAVHRRGGGVLASFEVGVLLHRRAPTPAPENHGLQAACA